MLSGGIWLLEIASCRNQVAVPTTFANRQENSVVVRCFALRHRHARALFAFLLTTCRQLGAGAPIPPKSRGVRGAGTGACHCKRATAKAGTAAEYRVLGALKKPRAWMLRPPIDCVDDRVNAVPFLAKISNLVQSRTPKASPLAAQHSITKTGPAVPPWDWLSLRRDEQMRATSCPGVTLPLTSARASY